MKILAGLFVLVSSAAAFAQANDLLPILTCREVHSRQVIVTVRQATSSSYREAKFETVSEPYSDLLKATDEARNVDIVLNSPGSPRFVLVIQKRSDSSNLDHPGDLQIESNGSLFSYSVRCDYLAK